MADTTLPALFQTGDHASRPAAGDVGSGALYSCTDHDLIYQSDGSSWTTWASLTGTGLSDPMTTRGDMIYRNASNVTDRLAIPAAGKVIGRLGSDLGAVFPPGYQFAYAAITGDVTTTSTTPADATGLSVSYTGDGGDVIVEAWAAELRTTGNAGGDVRAAAYLVDTTAAATIAGPAFTESVANNGSVMILRAKVTSASGTQAYKVQFQTVTAGTATLRAASTNPAFIRVTKV